MKATIGEYADFLVFDPGSLTGEPHFEIGGEKRPLAEGYAMFFSAIGPELSEKIIQKMDGTPE